MNPSSQTVSHLLAQAERAALDPEDLQVLLDAVLAPPHLQGYFFLLGRLMPVLECARGIYQLSGHEDVTIEPSMRSIPALLSMASEIENDPRLSHLFAPERGNARDAFLDILEEYPLYCTLGHSAHNRSLADHYTHLLAQTFLASHKVPPQDIPLLLKAYRGIRMLSQREYSSQLALLPAQPTTPQEFLALIRTAKKGTRLHDASALFEKAQLSLSPAPPAPAPKPKRATKPDDSEDPGEEGSPPEVAWTGTDLVESPANRPEADKAYRSRGGTSREFVFPRDDIPVVAPQERLYDRAGLRELAFQARQVSNRISMHNQLFPLSWEELNQFDLAILLHYLEGKTSGNGPILRGKDVRRLLLVMLWSGSPMERALEMDYFRNGGARYGAGHALYWDGGEAPFFRLLSPGPELSDETMTRDFPQALPTSPAANIPLPDAVRDILGPLLPDDPRTHDYESRPLFDPAAEIRQELQSALSACLRGLNRAHGTRLTATRISGYLLRNLARMPGQDLPSAALYFGYNEKLATTRIHYTHAPLPRLEDSFRTLCRELLTPLGYAATFPRPVNSPTAAVGTPWCPKEETIQDLVRRLSDTVEANRPDPGDTYRVAIFHNHYAVYTACFIAFATGYRAVRDPSFAGGDIDEATGLAFISDKTDDLGYSNRLVWMPEECLAQIRHYRQHLLALYDRIGPASPPLFNLIKNHCGPGRPARLFQLDLDLGQSQLLGPGLLSKVLARQFDYHLPPNANRHYLKNHLLKSGCPPEIIEAYLGHWELGLEPWHGLSGLRPSTFRQILQEHLPARLQADGWLPLPGFIP
ncbi:MAG: hypothetical protein RBT64_14445 [Trichloromonas sp.]|nr:hypothetical protein [Trichloromonas sp.]